MSYFKQTKDGYTLYSPSKTTTVELTCKGGALYYAVKENGKIRYGASPLGVCVGKDENSPVDYKFNNTLLGVTESVVTGREFTVLGRAEKRVENSVRFIVRVQNEEVVYELHFTLFDNGAAFRYAFPKSAGLFVFGESTEFKLAKSSKVYASFGCRHPGCNTALNGRATLCYECTYDEYNPRQKI